MNQEEIKENLQNALLGLVANLNGNRARVMELVQLMVEEIPEFFTLLRKDLNLQQWRTASLRIHRSKVQFSYLERDDIFTELSTWQTHLSGNEQKSIRVELERLHNIEMEALTVSSMLKLTEFYASQILSHGSKGTTT